MRPLGAQDILELCDSGATSGLASRALAVLERALPSLPHPDLPIGRRDALLMAVRAQTFGPRFTLLSTCPACAGKVEISLTAEDVGLAANGLQVRPAEAQVRRLAGHAVTLAPVTAGGLAEAEKLNDPHSLRDHLLSRCVLDIDGEPGAQLPDGIVALVEEALTELDPLAEIQLETSCPACGAVWEELFDAADLVWNDIRNQGARIMSEVAALARTYHWSERDILAMPAARRRFYLEAALA